jgi:hypothetical protein
LSAVHRPLLSLACCLAVAACLPAPAVAQTADQEERIGASFVLALGRAPARAEVEQWAKEAPQPLAALIARHRQYLQGDSAAARAVVAKAGEDAFGAAPADQGAGDLPAGAIYVELMKGHLGWLAQHPADYEQVVRRAYRMALDRDAYPVEIDYWKRQSTLSFALLAACIGDWALRNRPGLTATTGVPAISVNSPLLTTVRLSPAVAAEARVAAGLEAPGGDASAIAAGRNILAPGAGTIVSVGGIHFAAAGAGKPGAADR